MTIDIVAVTPANLAVVLPLIAEYQRFYGATPDEARNRAHFGRLATTPALGAQWLAHDATGQGVGFVTAYRVQSSVSAVEQCLLNDLYVVPQLRGQGLGRRLIVHCAAWAHSEGYADIHWQTALDNHTAQRLYDALPTTREAWYTYTLPVRPATEEGV
jgi:GNAT superfamily N-acetyltransferase